MNELNLRHYTSHIQNVSEIGFGGWQLGVESGWNGLGEPEALNLVKYALDQGVNFFDTAPNYGLGTGEERLGKALKGTDRSSIVINTKFGHTDDGRDNWSADHIRTSLEGSLRRLQTDYVDSLIIHNPPFEILDGNKNDHYEILERLKDEGKIKAYGASLDSYEEMKLLMDTTESKVIEAFFNIFWQDAARAFDMAKQNDVAIIVKIPLDSGWLSGKYDENSSFDGIRSRWSKKDIQTRASLVKKLRKIIGPDRNMVETSLAFCLSYDAVSTIIPGNVSVRQLEANLAAAETTLSEELVSKLEVFYEKEVRPLNIPW